MHSHAATVLRLRPHHGPCLARPFHRPVGRLASSLCKSFPSEDTPEGVAPRGRRLAWQRKPGWARECFRRFILQVKLPYSPEMSVWNEKYDGIPRSARSPPLPPCPPCPRSSGTDARPSGTLQGMEKTFAAGRYILPSKVDRERYYERRMTLQR